MPLSKRLAATQARRLAGVAPPLAQAYHQAVAQWEATPELAVQGTPFVTDGHRSPAEQDALYARGRTAPGPILTYFTGQQSKHCRTPAQALDVGFLTPTGRLFYHAPLAAHFARLMKNASPAVRWGGDWPRFKDLPHFEL